MVGSVERIAQEIAALDKAVAELAEELHRTYSTYLNVLGQAVRQQLILASYHVCTQGYPEAFLKLPYSQRQQLQQTLRNLAQQVNEELLAQLHIPVVVEDPEVERISLDELDLLLHDREPSRSETPTASSLAPLEKRASRPLTPGDLAEWQQDLEQAIAQELRTASHAANRLLQQAGVLPHKLPEPVLEAATKAEVSELGSSTPNLLNLIVEAADGSGAEGSRAEEVREHTVMHVIAIHLRLAEVEFADPTVTAARNQLRSLVARLKVLGREYRKKQREWAIAEAQAAWRSSWTED